MTENEARSEPVLVTPKHDLAGSGVNELHKHLRELLSGGETRVAIDLANVSQIDGCGLALLVECQHTISQRGGELIVLTENPDWKDLLRATRLDQSASVREAL